MSPIPAWSRALLMLAAVALAAAAGVEAQPANPSTPPETPSASTAAPPAAKPERIELPHPDPKITKEFHDMIFALAADSMEGRGIGTEGIVKASKWIENRMRAMKLEPTDNDARPGG